MLHDLMLFFFLFSKEHVDMFVYMFACEWMYDFVFLYTIVKISAVI